MASVWLELYRLLAARLLSDLLLPAQFALMRPAVPGSGSGALLFASCTCTGHRQACLRTADHVFIVQEGT